MKKITIYACRPRHVYKSSDDTRFLNYIKNCFNNSELLIEGQDFNYVKSLYMSDKIEKIVTKSNMVLVLHYNTAVDKYQYLEIAEAIINRVPTFAVDIKAKAIKKVIGFEKIFKAGNKRYATLNMNDIT